MIIEVILYNSPDSLWEKSHGDHKRIPVAQLVSFHEPLVLRCEEHTRLHGKYHEQKPRNRRIKQHLQVSLRTSLY